MYEIYVRAGLPPLQHGGLPGCGQLESVLHLAPHGCWLVPAQPPHPLLPRHCDTHLQVSSNLHQPPTRTISWLFQPHSRCSIKEFALQMGDMTRTNFLKQRLMVKMKFSLRLNILTTNSCLQSEKKLWRATVMMLLTWTVAWTPYALMFLASISGHRDLISHHGNMWAGNVQTRLTSLIIYVYRYNIIILYFISAVLCKISVSVNPFIYGLM